MVAERVSKSYGERPVVRDLSTRVLRGDRLGIVGPNGAGKTTLMRAALGLVPATGRSNLAALPPRGCTGAS